MDDELDEDSEEEEEKAQRRKSEIEGSPLHEKLHSLEKVGEASAVLRMALSSPRRLYPLLGEGFILSSEESADFGDGKKTQAAMPVA